MSQGIVAPRLIWVGSIQIDHVCFPGFGNVRGNSIREIAVRVDHSNSVAVRNVLHRQTFEQRRFARARLSYDVHMGEAVLSLDPK